MSLTYDALRAKLKLEIREQQRNHIERQILPSTDREKFNTFSIGQTVVSEGLKYEIIDRRANYFVVCNSDGEISKKFAHSLELSEESIEYKDGTYKGKNYPSVFNSIVESLDDSYVVLQAIEHYENRRYDLLKTYAAKYKDEFREITECVNSSKERAREILAEACVVDPETSFVQVFEIAQRTLTNKPSKQRDVIRKMLEIASPLLNV